jgi:heterodisulfide reductase subunit C
MGYLPNFIFLCLLVLGGGFFTRNILRIKRNILLGKEAGKNDQRSERWKHMFRVALGQSKMGVKPVAAALHLVVYIGFILINIELLEIILDGLLGTHRLFAPLLGSIYDFLIGSFEILALLVLIAVIFFWTRRNLVKIERFWKSEMKGWPKRDADYILYFEVVLMLLFLSMNATDALLQQQAAESYIKAGSFPVSQFLTPLFEDLGLEALILLERSFWWAHITGIIIFLNYLYYSKHLHILLAFPNTFYANLDSQGKFSIDTDIKREVMLMLFPEKAATEPESSSPPDKFGASDVFDLKWTQLMNAYSCTECGRCTEVCPANQTGKKLSPRKIMMDTRGRLEEVGININVNKGVFEDDQKQLLNDYISPEELWACTSCNACVEACPVAIDPLSIIMDMRQYLVMEQSAAPQELNAMMGNIENNGAPWPFSNQDRLQWINEK